MSLFLNLLYLLFGVKGMMLISKRLFIVWCWKFCEFMLFLEGMVY